MWRRVKFCVQNRYMSVASSLRNPSCYCVRWALHSRKYHASCKTLRSGPTTKTNVKSRKTKICYVDSPGRVENFPTQIEIFPYFKLYWEFSGYIRIFTYINSPKVNSLFRTENSHFDFKSCRVIMHFFYVHAGFCRRNFDSGENLLAALEIACTTWSVVMSTLKW